MKQKMNLSQLFQFNKQDFQNRKSWWCFVFQSTVKHQNTYHQRDELCGASIF